MSNINAFTITYTTVVDRLQTHVSMISNRKKIDVNALWDTGATNSCISKEAAKQLKLVPIGKVIISTASGSAKKNRYLVDICLPNNVVMRDITVCETAIGEQNLGLLIGMDIISTGDFAISKRNNATVFSFRHPSFEEINFVQQIRDSEVAATK